MYIRMILIKSTFTPKYIFWYKNMSGVIIQVFFLFDSPNILRSICKGRGSIAVQKWHILVTTTYSLHSPVKKEIFRPATVLTKSTIGCVNL